MHVRPRRAKGLGACGYWRTGHGRRTNLLSCCIALMLLLMNTQAIKKRQSCRHGSEFNTSGVEPPNHG